MLLPLNSITIANRFGGSTSTQRQNQGRRKLALQNDWWRPIESYMSVSDLLKSGPEQLELCLFYNYFAIIKFN